VKIFSPFFENKNQQKNVVAVVVVDVVVEVVEKQKI
jgi:hypothetical protein